MAKIKITEGCICDSFTVDGANFSDLETPEKVKLLDKCIDFIKKNNDEYNEIENIIIEIVEYYGKYKCLGHCEECGDTIREYTLNV